jgi:succinoglycan biosynthesis transport protein ExoP
MNLLTSTPLSGAAPRKLEQFVPPAAGTGDAERDSRARQYLRIAKRWRYVILGAILAFLLLGLVGTLLMTPQYTAATTIEISRESDKVTGFQGVQRDTTTADQEFYQTQYGLLRSRALSERVAAQLGFVDSEKFFKLFGFPKQDPAFQVVGDRYSAAGRTTRQRIAGQTLLGHLGVVPTRLSQLVEVNFVSPDPDLSARVANAWADNFIQSNLERKVQATSYGRNLLERQLGQMKEKLDQSQRQLVGYASQEQIINLPAQTSSDGKTTQERSIVADNLGALSTALSQATADRIQAEARFRAAGRGGSTVEALNNQAINNLRQKRAELAADYQRLMVQFEPGYPAARAIKSQIDVLDGAIGREESRVSGSVQADYQQSRAREHGLQAKVNELKSSYLDLRRRAIQYNIYQQEVDTNRALYDGLLQRFKEIGVAGGVGINNVAVVDTADVPQKPSSPRLMLNLLASLFAGLMLGAGLAILLEQMDEAIADPGEIERQFGLPLLGSVPRVENVSPREALLDRKSELIDAYIAVQTNLGFTTEHGVPRSLAITSTRPAEGKSTTALALATTLARAKRRVILIDGDMRAPSVHQLGGVGHAYGLSNFLAGQDNIEAMTFQMSDLGFTAMSAGPIPPNAAELLTGNRLSVLIERLLDTYDHVIVDSPPVMGLADAPLIAGRVEGVVYVVESHGIRSSMVKTALARLASANAHIIGGVLTKFDSRKAHYGYGYEYGYGYGRTDASESNASG